MCVNIDPTLVSGSIVDVVTDHPTNPSHISCRRAKVDEQQ